MTMLRWLGFFFLPLLVLCVAAAASDIAFVDANVITMDDERVLRNCVIVVRAGRIVSVGRAATIPSTTIKITATGKWILPGLADMHVHNEHEEEHLLFLAKGVTSIRNMSGSEQHLQWQRDIAAGRRLAPTIYTTGPIIDGKGSPLKNSVVVLDRDQARAAVAQQARKGFKAVKVYTELNAEAYAGVVEEATARGMRIEGHVPWRVGLRGALIAGQDSIEHLHGYPLLGTSAEVQQMLRVSQLAGAWNCVTLLVYRDFVPASETKRLLRRPEMAFVHPRLRAEWAKDPRGAGELGVGAWTLLRRMDTERAALTKLLNDATGRVMLGTDSGTPFVVSGWAVHRELALLVDAGLTPFQALSCATRRPAEYLGEPFGVIEPGRRADLIMVEGNPLEDVRRVAEPLGVMVRGRWIGQEEIAQRLDKLAASYESHSGK